MRICRVVNVLPTPEQPGGGLLFYYLAKHIPEPTLFITRDGGAPGVPFPPHVEILGVAGADRPAPPGLRRAIVSPKPPSRSVRVALKAAGTLMLAATDARFFLQAAREMRRFRPDLVICSSLRRLPCGLFARYALGARLILSLHNTTEATALRRSAALRALARVPDRIVVVSRAIERELHGLVDPQRVVLSSTGVDLEQFSDWRLPRKPQLVTIGSFKWKKGYACLLEAAALVFPRFPDHRLVVVGDGEERPEILRTIARLGLEGRVVLAGTLPRAEIVRLLNESALFVLASLHEGLPKALLEALACGTPAVVTDACNAEGLIETTGLSVPAADAAALAKGIITILEDDVLRERCAANGPPAARAYDWPAVAAREYAVYREVLDQ